MFTSTSSCIGSCITSVPGCDVRGPLTQTGLVTITDDGGNPVTIPCPFYIEIWNSVEATKSNTPSTTPPTTPAASLTTNSMITAAPYSNSSCVGNCITSVPGCDVRGPTTQTGIVTITDAGGNPVPVPCPVYISLWNDAQSSQNSTIPSNATITSPPPSTSSCVGNCITSVPGCDVRGPTTQTGFVTITDVGGALIPVPCSIYQSIWSSIEASTSNATTTISGNATTTTSSNYPNYVYDYNTTTIGSCDLFGALCQTGTIDALVNINGTTSTTAVACSSYLSAQKDLYLSQHQNEGIGDPGTYALSFGRSPQCATFSSLSIQSGALAAATQTYDPLGGFPASLWSSNILQDYSIAGYTLSGTSWIAPKATPLPGCPANASSFDTSLFPGGVQHYAGAGHQWDCCGWCLLLVPELQVFYWPDGSTNSSIGSNTTNSTQLSIDTKPQGARKRAPSLPDSGPQTAVVDGYT